jgi:FAD/FMN-containing dehydrogenase
MTASEELKPVSEELIQSLKDLVGPKGYVEGEDVGERYYSDFRGIGDNRPQIALRPASTEELSEIMKLCHGADQPVVAQGGMTGLVSAARPQGSEIPISFERLNQIEDVDAHTGTMTVQCGTPLQIIQERAAEDGFIFPLDLGARGSCTIGGNLSTNAGGNRVIRYGMTRDLILGVEAVLADGTIVNSLNKLIKNNTGYDLKQLFIGSEGTLGLVTRVVLRLSRKPRSQTMAFCALPNFDAVVNFMQYLQSSLGGSLSAYEVMWQSAYQATIDKVSHVKAPMAGEHPFYVLTEAMGGHQERDQENYETVMGEALEQGLLSDAVIAQSEGMEEFASELDRRIGIPYPGVSNFIFGHLGDGNLHVVVKVADQLPQPSREVNDIVYSLVGELSGSVSAEHGIGMLKRDYLHQSRSPAELALMRNIKTMMDPKGLLNPNRIFELTKAA